MEAAKAQKEVWRKVRWRVVGGRAAERGVKRRRPGCGGGGEGIEDGGGELWCGIFSGMSPNWVVVVSFLMCHCSLIRSCTRIS